jgi:hypothetical protein
LREICELGKIAPKLGVNYIIIFGYSSKQKIIDDYRPETLSTFLVEKEK